MVHGVLLLLKVRVPRAGWTLGGHGMHTRRAVLRRLLLQQRNTRCPQQQPSRLLITVVSYSIAFYAQVDSTGEHGLRSQRRANFLSTRCERLATRYCHRDSGRVKLVLMLHIPVLAIATP